MNDEVFRVIRAAVESNRWTMVAYYDGISRHLTQALSESGLISTPAMRQAVEACKAFDDECPPGFNTCADEYGTPGYKAVRRAARRALAEEAERAPKPRARYEVGTSTEKLPFYVYDTEAQRRPAHGLTEQQARAVAATLNELERGK